MIHFDLPKEKSSILKVIGVGGGRITVSEMNGGRGCGVRRDTYRVGRGVSFIHRR